MKKESFLFGQITFDMILPKNGTKALVTKEEKEDYLTKGERIVTLLREKSQRMFSFERSTFFDAFSATSYFAKCETIERMRYIHSTVQNKIVRPALDSVEGSIEVFELQKGLNAKLDFTSLYDLFGRFKDLFQFSLVADSEAGERMIHTFFHSKNEKPKYVLRGICEANQQYNREFYFPAGSKARITTSKSGVHYSFRSSKPKENELFLCVDGGNYLAAIIFFSLLYENTQKRLKEEHYEGVITEFLRREQLKINETYLKENSEKVYVLEEDVAQCSFIQKALEEYQIPYELISEEGLKKEHILLKYVMQYSDFLPYFFLVDVVPRDLLLERRLVKINKSKTRYLYTKVNYNNPFILKLFENLMGFYEQDKVENEYLKDMESTYAKSYETKKTISEKVLKAMEESEFNDYFGYVEYDDECDLASMEVLYKNFRALADLFHWEKRNDVSLRFRRLGNHKAAGLYYYILKCLCVDVRHPSSMAHEYFHMLDYENGKLSTKNEFYSVYESYKQCLLRIKEQDTCARASLSGKGKYNINYYLNHSEVFARCGEMYLIRTLGIDSNSLLKLDTELYFAYPKDDELMELVNAYFKKFLGKDE